MSPFLVSAGFPLTNPTIPSTSTHIPVVIEITAPTHTSTPTPTPTSTPIAIPNTIVSLAYPHPTATLPQCYDGLHDDSPLVTVSPTSSTTMDLIANGPGLLVRYLLIWLALASTLADRLVRTPVLRHGLICTFGLVCVSRLCLL